MIGTNSPGMPTYDVTTLPRELFNLSYTKNQHSKTSNDKPLTASQPPFSFARLTSNDLHTP
jgi:hypothetical protein